MFNPSNTCFALLAAGSLLFQGCGKNGIGSQLIKNLSVHSSPVQNDVMVHIEAVFNAGNLMFPLISLPIVDPKVPTRPFGTLTLQRTLDGRNVLGVDLNVSRISNTDGLVAPNLLPNGNQIPVAGVRDLIAFQAGSSSRVYLSLNETSKMLGVAVAVKEFDSIAQYVPGANLFFEFPQQNGIRGTAGIFTGVTSGQSGFGLFIDATEALSNLVNPGPNRILTISEASDKVTAERRGAVASTERAAKSAKLETQANRVEASHNHEAVQFIYGSNKSSWTTRRLQMRAYQLGQKKKRLTVRH